MEKRENLYTWHINEKGQEVARPYIIYDELIEEHKQFMKEQEERLKE